MLYKGKGRDIKAWLNSSRTFEREDSRFWYSRRPDYHRNVKDSADKEGETMAARSQISIMMAEIYVLHIYLYIEAKGRIFLKIIPGNERVISVINVVV